MLLQHTFRFHCFPAPPVLFCMLCLFWPVSCQGQGLFLLSAFFSYNCFFTHLRRSSTIKPSAFSGSMEAQVRASQLCSKWHNNMSKLACSAFQLYITVWVECVKNARVATVLAKKILSILTGHTVLNYPKMHLIALRQWWVVILMVLALAQHCTSVATVTNMYNF